MCALLLFSLVACAANEAETPDTTDAVTTGADDTTDARRSETRKHHFNANEYKTEN
jgi:hypothetical protein